MHFGKRIQELEDRESVRDLTARYAYRINQGWNGMAVNAEAISEIFSVNASWACEAMNMKVQGREAIIKSLMEETREVRFAMHSYTNPLITISGGTAIGQWLFWVVSKPGFQQTNQVFMSQRVDYIRTDEGWRIHHLELFFGDMVRHKHVQSDT